MRIPLLLLAVAAVSSAETRLGKALTLHEPVSVDQLMETAESLGGKVVQVKGKVSEVCQMAGCWMQLNGTGGAAVRIKVNDGDIVFPASAPGKMAIAEGFLQKLQLTREQAVARAKHEAEERGTKFNPSSIKTGSVSWEIRGVGAVFPD